MQSPCTPRVALITGAGTGFGRLTAEALARSGYRTYAGVRDVARRNAALVAELAAEDITAVEMDVTNDASVDAAAARVLGESGHVDVLVNNAGAAYFGLTETFTPALAREQFEVNVFGVLRTNRAFLPSMRDRHSGLVVYVSSVVGRFVIPFAGMYVATKHAIEALAEASAYELRPSGVDVSIVEPSAMRTSIFDKQRFSDDEARSATYGTLASKPRELAVSMVARATDPQAVADAIVAIAALPPGRRPLRRVVGDAEVAGRVNAVLAPIQHAVLARLGLASLEPAVTADDAALAVAG